MQVARYWRMKEQRYQFKGIRYENGVYAIQDRPINIEVEVEAFEATLKQDDEPELLTNNKPMAAL